MDNQSESKELKGISYEIFLTVITVLSIFNIFLYWITSDEEMKQVIFLLEIILCIFFILDFLYRLISAENRYQYFVNQYGWLDFLGSLPVIGFRILRIFRVIRIVRILRELGLRKSLKEIFENQAGAALAVVGFCVILVLEFGSYFIIRAEATATNSNIITPIDAIWWSIVTIATVGYGDEVPVTNTGRIIGSIVIITGVALFSILIGFLSNRFVSTKEEKEYFEMSHNILEKINKQLEQQTKSIEVIESRLSVIESELNQEE
jgi:voltage-gated potassium channel Kch